MPELFKVIVAADRPAFNVMSLPVTTMGPFTDRAPLTVIPAVLPDLPRRRPPRLEPNAKLLVLSVLVKLEAEDSMASRPGPLKVLLAVLGALFCSTSVVALSMDVVPV